MESSPSLSLRCCSPLGSHHHLRAEGVHLPHGVQEHLLQSPKFLPSMLQKLQGEGDRAQFSKKLRLWHTMLCTWHTLWVNVGDNIWGWGATESVRKKDVGLEGWMVGGLLHKGSVPLLRCVSQPLSGTDGGHVAPPGKRIEGPCLTQEPEASKAVCLSQAWTLHHVAELFPLVCFLLPLLQGQDLLLWSPPALPGVTTQTRLPTWLPLLLYHCL